MRNLTVKRTVLVEVYLTADQWQLYSNQEGDPEGGRDMAAKELNIAFAEAVNAGKTDKDIWAAMGPVMKKWSNLGAMDSEGYHTVEDLIEATFGKVSR